MDKEILRPWYIYQETETQKSGLKIISSAQVWAKGHLIVREVIVNLRAQIEYIKMQKLNSINSALQEKNL